MKYSRVVSGRDPTTNDGVTGGTSRYFSGPSSSFVVLSKVTLSTWFRTPDASRLLERETTVVCLSARPSEIFVISTRCHSPLLPSIPRTPSKIPHYHYWGGKYVSKGQIFRESIGNGVNSETLRDSPSVSFTRKEDKISIPSSSHLLSSVDGFQCYCRVLCRPTKVGGPSITVWSSVYLGPG